MKKSKKGLKEIVSAKLSFLVTEYNFECLYDTYRQSIIPVWIYKNTFGLFCYMEHEIFGEISITVETNDGQKVHCSEYELYERYKDIYNLFQNSHKGIKWFFKDLREDRMDMIADIIKREIELTGRLFGLQLIS